MASFDLTPQAAQDLAAIITSRTQAWIDSEGGLAAFNALAMQQGKPVLEVATAEAAVELRKAFEHGYDRGRELQRGEDFLATPQYREMVNAWVRDRLTAKPGVPSAFEQLVYEDGVRAGNRDSTFGPKPQPDPAASPPRRPVLAQAATVVLATSPLWGFLVARHLARGRRSRAGRR